MKPEVTATSAAPEGSQRRRVRLFVAVHLGALGEIYALALIVGGGFEGPPMPPLSEAPATAYASRLVPDKSAPIPPVVAWEPTALPAWEQRAEITRPWESR